MIKLIANLLIIFLLFIPKVSAIEDLALPTGPQVTEGEVTINNQISGTLNINQISSSATIEWTTFNVGSKASVYFNQPTNTSSIYNDVRSGRSIINGKIYANGKLFLHNPSGIYLGPYSAVQGQGIVLSTLNLLNKNSQTQEHFYASQSDANLETQGLIEAGYVTLISSSIKQLGTIKATGDVQLAASDEVYLKILPNSQLTVKVEPSEIQTALDNQGGIISSQGQVFLKSDIAQSFVDQSINHSNLQATELVNDNGVFKLVSNSGNIKANNIQLSSGKKGATNNSGVLDASTDFDGGIISIEGNQISIQENSILNATGKNQGGQIKIGGDWQGQGSMIQAETTSIDKNTTINASSLGEGDGGTIVVWSNIKNPSSATSVKGDLIASAINGQGGNIETSGYHLDISSVNINASSDQGADGLWLIDPVDFTIASSGGDMTGSALTTSLASASVTILSSGGSSGTEGDININDAVTWSANKLTLNANNNIYINADLLGSGSAQLDLLYGQGAVASGNTSDYSILKTSSADSTSFSAQVTLADGNNFSTTLGSDGSAINYQVISDLSSLTDANVNYALGSDIDATARASSQYVLSGSNSTIDGLGHTIDGLTLAWTNANGTGLVGNSGSGFAIKNLGLTNINYSHSLGSDTRSFMGAFLGSCGAECYIGNSYATGTMSGGNYIGGLIGQLWSTDTATINNSSFTGTITATHYTGGLIGYIPQSNLSSRTVTIKNSKALANIYAIGGGTTDSPQGDTAGGLIGYLLWYNSLGNTISIDNSDFSGIVKAGTNAGGIIGNADYKNSQSNTTINPITINNSRVTGATISGKYNLGGMIGNLSYTGVTISDSSVALGSVEGTVGGTYTGVGGLIGMATLGSTSNQDINITNSFTSNSVTNISTTANGVGGLIGTVRMFNSPRNNSINITDSYSLGSITGPSSGTSYVGGLIGDYIAGAYANQGLDDLSGYIDFNIVRSSHRTGAISGANYTGGLVGRLNATANTVHQTFVINNSYNTGDVSGLNYTGGLFGQSAGAKTITINNSYNTGDVSGLNYTGGLTGQFYGTGTETGTTSSIEDSYVTGNITTPDWSQTGNYVGGLVGLNSGAITINRSRYSGNIATKGSYIGGLIGQSTFAGKTQINASYTSGSITNDPFNTLYTELGVGGLVGYISNNAGYADIDASYSSMNINTAAYSYNGTSSVPVGSNGSGGLIGYDWGTITATTINDSYNTGNIKAVGNVGGLVAVSRNRINIDDSYNSGNINTSNYELATVTYRADEIFAGGLLGYTTGYQFSIVDSYNTGNITQIGNPLKTWEQAGAVGGILGGDRVSAGTINRVFNSGDISGSTRVGGIVGYLGFSSSGPSINESFNTGDISGEGYVGGIAGVVQNTLGISNVYNRGDITANDTGIWSIGHAAGIAGIIRNVGSVTNAYNSGAISGTSQSRAITSKNETNSFYDSVTSGSVTTIDAVGKTTAYMQSSAFAVDLNAGSSIWGYDASVNSGYPYLLGNTPQPVITFTANNLSFTYGTTIDTSSFLANNYYTISGGYSLAEAFSTNPGFGIYLGDLLISDTTPNTGSYSITPSGGTVNSGYLISYNSGTLTVNAKALTVSGITASNKTYDGNATANVTLTLSGAIDGETVTSTNSSTFNNKNADSGKTVTVNSITLNDTNYSISSGQNTTANIIAKALTVSGITASNKTYDGNATANVALTLSGVIDGETVTSTNSSTFNNKNADSGKTVTVNSITLNDTNYSISSGQNTTANIIAKALTVSGITASNKTYDGNAIATLSTASASYDGLVSGDDLTVSASGAFSDKNVGTGKTVTLTSSYSGDDYTNYSITSQSSTTANIIAKALTVSGITASNKTYDGNAIAALSTASASYDGLVSGDDLTVSASGAFSDKNVGTGKTVTLTSSYSGNDISNYSIIDQSSTTANIIAKALTVSGITASNKTYDGNAIAALSTASASYDGLVSGDDLTVSASGAFSDKNVGTGKTVTLTSSYSGDDYTNYSITSQSSTTANIIAKALTVSGITASNKTYDGNAIATLSTASASYDGLVSGDDLTVSASGAFSDKNVGTGKTVTLTSSYSGDDYTNYSITSQSSTTANIIAKALTVSGITASNKTYDGNTLATIDVASASYTGLVDDDSFVVAASGVFNNKNVGTDKTVALTSTYSGDDIANYSITNQSSTAANIVQLSSVTWTGDGEGDTWSTAANWTSSAIPDNNNVAAVVIPANASVEYDADNLGVVGSTITNMGTLTFTGSTDVNFPNVISGTGSVIKSGTGSLTLSGANTFSGGINYGSSTLIISNSFAATSFTSSGGNLSISPTLSTIDVTGPTTISSDITTTGTQRYRGDIIVASGSIASPVEFSNTNADIIFDGTLKADATGKSRSMTFDAGTANLIFNDRIGYNFNTADFDSDLTADSFYKMIFNAGSITVKGDVMTFEEQVYNGPVIIGSNNNGVTRTLLSMDPAITFNNTINDTIANTHSLIAKAVEVRRVGEAATTPVVTFASYVGNNISLASHQGLTGYQIIDEKFGNIDTSIDFGTVNAAPIITSNNSSSAAVKAKKAASNAVKSIRPIRTTSGSQPSMAGPSIKLSRTYSIDISYGVPAATPRPAVAAPAKNNTNLNQSGSSNNFTSEPRPAVAAPAKNNTNTNQSGSANNSTSENSSNSNQSGSANNSTSENSSNSNQSGSANNNTSEIEPAGDASSDNNSNQNQSESENNPDSDANDDSDSEDEENL